MAGFEPSQLQQVLDNPRLHRWYKKQLKPRLKEHGYPDTCPLHESLSGTSFQTTKNQDGWICRACEVGGGHVDLAFYEKHGVDAKPTAEAYEEILLELAEQHGVDLPEELQSTDEERQARAKRTAIHKLLAAAQEHFEANLFSSRGKAERDYLLGPERGFSWHGSDQDRPADPERMIKDGHIGLHLGPDDLRSALTQGDHDLDLAAALGLLSASWAKRLTIPILAPNLKLVALAGRRGPEQDDGDKWRYTTGFDKSFPLFLGYAKKMKQKDVVVVEGVFDGLLHQVNALHDTIAAGSRELTDKQVELLVRHGIESVTLSFDADQAGRKGTRITIERLAMAGIPTYVMAELAGGLDPDLFLAQHGVEAWKQIRDQAEPALLWLAKDSLRELPEEGAAQKAKNAALKRYRELLLELATKASWAEVEDDVLGFLTKRTALGTTKLRTILKTKKLPEQRQQAASSTHKFRQERFFGGNFEVQGKAMFIIIFTEHAALRHQLTNFVSRIVKEIDVDDGFVRQKYFEILTVLSDGSERRAEVRAADFNSMKWVVEVLGPRAIVASGTTRRDQARQAIQEYSVMAGCQHEARLAHTGWFDFGDNNWGFCHAGGVIGVEVDVVVDLGAEQHIGLVRLPDPPEGQELVRAIHVLFSLIEVLGMRLFAPLFGHTYHAPLSEWDPTDWILFLAGTTGSKKSSIASLSQACFGSGFKHNLFPGSFESTFNALAKHAAQMKDAIYVVDDLVPKADRYDDHRKKAQHLIRGQGNQAGRARLNADTSNKVTYYPRCAMIMTGEDIPLGVSDRARLALIQVDGDAVELKGLTAFEPHREVLSQVMAAYISWLAERTEWVAKEVPALRQRFAAEFAADGAHDRVPTNYAGIMTGFHMLLAFAEHAGAYDGDEVEARREVAQKELSALMLKQQGALQEENPARRFLDLLTAALRSGKAYVVNSEPYSGRTPMRGAVADSLGGPELLGWATEAMSTGVSDMAPRGEFVGYLGRLPRTLYLDPNSAMAAVQRSALAQGRPFEMSATSIWRDLHEAGLLVETDIAKEGRNTYLIRRRVRGQAGAFIYIRIPVVETDSSEDLEQEDVAHDADQHISHHDDEVDGLE